MHLKGEGGVESMHTKVCILDPPKGRGGGSQCCVVSGRREVPRVYRERGRRERESVVSSMFHHQASSEAARRSFSFGNIAGGIVSLPLRWGLGQAWLRVNNAAKEGEESGQ